MTKLLPDGRVCVCRSVLQLPFAKPTPSRRAAVSVPERLLGGRRRGVECALSRV